MKNNSALERLYNGIIKENPTLVLSINVLQYDYFYSA